MAAPKGYGFFVSNRAQKAIKKRKKVRIEKARTSEKARRADENTGFFAQHIVTGKTTQVKIGD